MIYLAGITLILLLISFIADKQKTKAALKTAVKKLVKILIPVGLMLIPVSIVLALFPGENLSHYLSSSNIYISVLLAALIGSISMLPGFIAFPLGGILRVNGVPFMVISAFTSTLMMVGVLTFPVERAYLGTKVALLRNIISFVIAILVALVTGLYFGEVFI